MEGSERESEVIFESLNLNPQLFINEVLNSVDDLVDEAFNCFQEYSSLFLFFLALMLIDVLISFLFYSVNIILNFCCMMIGLKASIQNAENWRS